jgi:putative ATP-dependent endonuclease of the OLD family
MRLKSIQIQNLRCLENCAFNLRDFSTLIGPNNSGKSSLLRGIEIFLNQLKPEPEEWRNGHEEEEIIIEGCFEGLQDWERDTPGIAGIIYNGEIRLRMRALLENNGRGIRSVSPPRYEAFCREEVIQGWADSWRDLSQTIKDIAEEQGYNGQSWRTAANKERVKQILRGDYSNLITYGDETWTSESISINSALKQAIPQAVVIEAVKDASDDIKPTAKTTFGLLLNKLILPTIQLSQEYQELLSAVEALNARIRGSGVDKFESVRQLEEELFERMSSIVDARAYITLDTPDTDKFIGGSTSIKIDDGTETPISLQGHGVQRALIFALIEVLAKQNSLMETAAGLRNFRSILLLFEEPELYIHPHLMRRLKIALQGIAQSSNWQVVISTHSPFFIDVASDPCSLIILKRQTPSGCPAIVQLTTDPFGEDIDSQHDKEALRAALDFHPSVTEAFFAKRVVFVEGDTEVAVLRHSNNLLSLIGIDGNQVNDTSIISCGGKWTILSMARLLNEFQIPYRVIHDRDRQGKTDEELLNILSIHPYRANNRIREIAGEDNVLIIDDTFEHVFGEDTSIPHSEKPYNAWRRVQEICQQDGELLNYPRLVHVIQFAYNW